MKLTSVSLNHPCRSCGGYEFRMESDRRDERPVVCAKCGHFAGLWGKLRGNGLSGTSEDFSTMLSGLIGRSLSRRRHH